MFSVLKYKKFDFGERIIHQFIIFEFKPLFGILFFYFTKSNNKQDRFHTHAFNALSIKLFGSYNEYLLLDEKTGEYIKQERKSIFKYFPRNSYHKIGESKNGCLTLLLMGSWNKTWKEYKDGITTEYTWNRQIYNT